MDFIKIAFGSPGSANVLQLNLTQPSNLATVSSQSAQNNSNKTTTRGFVGTMQLASASLQYDPCNYEERSDYSESLFPDGSTEIFDEFGEDEWRWDDWEDGNGLLDSWVDDVFTDIGDFFGGLFGGGRDEDESFSGDLDDDRWYRDENDRYS